MIPPMVNSQLWKLMAVGVVIALTAIAVHNYGAKRYEAGRQEIIQQDLKLLQERLIENAKQAERDRLAIENARKQYEELQSQSSVVAADLGRRLGVCISTANHPSPVPRTDPGAGVVTGPARESSSDEAAARLTEAVVAACARDADRLKALQDLVKPRRN